MPFRKRFRPVLPPLLRPFSRLPPRKWTVAEIEALFALPFMDLVWRAQQVHREHFDANEIQRSTLLSVKTGGCSEDCGYCSQSARNKTELEREEAAGGRCRRRRQAAKAKGASRFCMGAAWRARRTRIWNRCWR